MMLKQPIPDGKSILPEPDILKVFSITKSEFTIDEDVYVQALWHGPVIMAISLHDKISFDLKILISTNDINIHLNRFILNY